MPACRQFPPTLTSVRRHGEKDSPVEEWGIEPSVPRRIDDPVETAIFAFAALPVPPERPTRFARETCGSNSFLHQGVCSEPDFFDQGAESFSRGAGGRLAWSATTLPFCPAFAGL
jgi:hypothetical protein